MSLDSTSPASGSTSTVIRCQMQPQPTIVDARLIATIGIPSIVVILGWFFVHWLNARRDLASRKSEARLKALETAYLRLTNGMNRPLTAKSMDEIETFVSELQLYGTPRQIQMMIKIVEEFKKPNNIISYDDILKDLRDTIRKELNLEPVSGEVWWLRLGRNSIVPPNPEIIPGAPIPFWVFNFYITFP